MQMEGKVFEGVNELFDKEINALNRLPLTFFFIGLRHDKAAPHFPHFTGL